MVITMWTSLNKKIYILLCIILLIGIICGIIFVTSIDESTKEIIFLNINNYFQNITSTKINNIILHLIFLSTIFVLSIFLLGGPIIIFYIFYNGFSIGFIISSLTNIFGLKGLIYSCIYVIISKLLFLIILILLSNTLLKLVKYIIDRFVYKKNNFEYIYFYMKKSLIFICIAMINDIILYFGGIKLLNLFNFLII